MAIVIRLQNLPWSANSVDIRRFFAGLSIPEGGVHIVGGEMGDAFIAFSTDEDARLAMEKNGGKIKDMQIKLLLSSRTEMMRVIEQARQQNMVATQPHVVPPQPARIMTPTTEPDRRRGRSPTPPRRRSRDRSPSRDRRRSPDDRRGSKRDRSRSPRSSRGFSRDTDRRSDRFKRDDRRYDDSRYRDDRRSTRESSQEPKKYYDADHVNSRSQLHATEGFRNMQPSYEQTSNAALPGLYPFGNQPSATVPKSFPEAYAHQNPTTQLSQTERSAPNKSVDFSLMDQKLSSSAAYPHEKVPFHGSPFEPSVPSSKESSVPSAEQKPRRRHTRFEPEFVPTSTTSHFITTDKKPTDSQREASYSARLPSGSYPETRSAWPHEVSERSEDTQWNDKRQGLLSHPTPSNGDFLQVVPMDLDPPSEMTPEKEIYLETPSPRGSQSYVRKNESPRNDELRRDVQNRESPDSKGPPMHDRGLSMHDRTPSMHDRTPSMHDRGPSMHDRGPPTHDRGPPTHDRGPSTHGLSGHNENRGILNDTHGRVPPSLTVEVRGLPPDARIDHILDLFRGIPLPAANIRIEANDQGFEKAYIRFVSAADFEEALNRNRRFMHEGRCELVPCPASAFDSATRSQKPKPKPKPREEDLTVQLRGLPFSCKDDDVVTFFDGLGILDLYIVVAPNGKASGTGFVEFGTPEDFRAALAMNGKMIGHRYITVSVASKEMMAYSRGEEYTPIVQPTGPHPNTQYSSSNSYPPTNQGQVLPNQIRPPLNHGRPPMNQGRQPPSGNQIRPPPPGSQGRPLPLNNQGRPPSCISMKGLPEGVSNRNIADFLGQIGIMPQAVHIMLRPDKTPCGDAFAEFMNPQDMERALELSGKMMVNNRILIQPISFHEMMEILGRPTPMPPPPSAPTALLRTPCDVQRPRRPLLPQSPGEPPFRERPPRMIPPNRGSRPFMGPVGRPRGAVPGRMRAPWFKARNFNSNFRPDGRFPPPSSEFVEKDFGSPGCVVSINNLHFNAGLEELLDFFSDYKITKDDIIRRYNENRQTTGEARVAFRTPRDAQRAVRELNHKSIMDRPLTLSVL